MHDIMWIHMTSHPLLWYHTTLWLSHTLYSCHHTQDTCHRIHCSWAFTYNILIRGRLQYVWYQTTLYDIIWILCDITTTFTDIKRLHSWHHIHNIPEYRTDCIRHNIHYTCDITATVTMTRHLQYFWHDTQCIWDLSRWMNDNTTTVSDMIPNVSV